MRFARQSSTQVDTPYNNYISQDLFRALRNFSEEQQASVSVHDILPNQQDTFNRHLLSVAVDNMPSRHLESSQDFPVFSGLNFSLQSGLGHLNDLEDSIYDDCHAPSAYNGLPCATGPQSLHSTNQSASIQCPPVMQWQPSNQYWAHAGHLFPNPNVDPQQLQPKSIAMQRNISSATNSSAGRVSTASPYQQPAQRFHQAPYFSSHSASPSPFTASSSYDDQGSINNPVDIECAISEDENSGAPAYNKLIYQCLRSASNCEMQLKDIYEWFRENTEKRWAANEKGWQNSIRHNLSMNVAFQKGSRSDPENPKKTMWCLTDEAIEEGIWPTTRYRKNNERQSHRNRLLGSPAPQRQISGARGGNAARRSQRLKLQEAVASRRARPFSSTRTRPQSRAWTAASTPAMTPALGVTYPSPTTGNIPSYNLDESYDDTGLHTPYFTQTPLSTPLLTNDYLDNGLPIHNSAQAFLPFDTDTQFFHHHSDPTLFAAPGSSVSFCQSHLDAQQFANDYETTALDAENTTVAAGAGDGAQPWNYNYFSYYPQEFASNNQATDGTSTSLANPYTQSSALLLTKNLGVASPLQLPSQLFMANGGNADMPQSEGLSNNNFFASSDEEQDEPKTPASATDMKWDGSFTFEMEDEAPMDR